MAYTQIIIQPSQDAVAGGWQPCLTGSMLRDITDWSLVMAQKLFSLLLIASAGVAVAQSPAGIPSTPGAAPSSTAPGSSGLPSRVNSAVPHPMATPGTNPAMPASAGNMGGSESGFKQLDKNSDGYLSAEEMNSISGSGTNASSAARFTAMDTNHDGKVSAAEYAAAQAGSSRVPAKDITSDPTGQAHASRPPAATTSGKSQP